jgi:valyl-tRNA synthetase
LDREQVSIQAAGDKPADAVTLVVGPVEVHIPLSGMVDLDAERLRQEKELAGVAAQVERLEKLLGSDFANKAPAEVVQKERERLAALVETAEKMRAQLG